MTIAEIQRKKIREMLGSGAHVTWSEMRREGVSRRALVGMVESGELVRSDHNVYSLATAPVRRFAHWEDVAAKYEEFVVCLLSAAQHHGISGQMPSELWVALPRGSKPTNPSLRVIQWPLEDGNGARHPKWTEGVETVEADGGTYRVTGAARTVVDLFLWQDRISDGRRISLEALNEYDDRGLSRADLRRVAKAFGVNDEISRLLVAKGEFRNRF